MDAQPIYTEYLRPRGFGWGAASIVEVPSGNNFVFSIEKLHAAGPVCRSDIDLLDAVRPHLARAALMAARLEFGRITAALEALQMTCLPSAVLGLDGRLLATVQRHSELTPWRHE